MARILIIEGEPSVFSIIRETVEDAGHRFVDGTRYSLPREEEEDEPDLASLDFDVAVVDLIRLPEERLKLLEQFLRANPGMPVVALTSPAEATAVGSWMGTYPQLAQARFLQRPFPRKSLERCLAEALESAGLKVEETRPPIDAMEEAPAALPQPFDDDTRAAEPIPAGPEPDPFPAPASAPLTASVPEPPSPQAVKVEPEETPPAHPPEGAEGSESAEARISIFTQPGLRKGEWFDLQLWVFPAGEDDAVRALAEEGGRSAEMGEKCGSSLPEPCPVSLTIRPEFVWTKRGWGRRRKTVRKSILWNGLPTNVEFPVFCPKGVRTGQVHERFEVAVGGIPVGECSVRLDFDAGCAVQEEFRTVQSAFASYSSEDREAVIGRLQMLEELWGMKTFFEVDSLRSGDDWETRLKEEVPTKDKFLLFWSPNAAKSPWVEREWRLALEKRGLGYIEPVPVRPCKPPRSLRSLQFDDRFSMMADYERLKRDAAG